MSLTSTPSRAKRLITAMAMSRRTTSAALGSRMPTRPPSPPLPPPPLPLMSFKPPYTFISPRQLAAMVKTEGKVPGKDFAVIDVRGEDYAGGHIKGAIHQSSQTLPHGGVEEIRQKTKNVPTVIFHCLLSQVRGPESARLYAASTAQLRMNGGDAPVDQEVLVLRGGFTEFQALYKDDKDLVEDYDQTKWEY